jgi:DNA polymerase elongation subunit (family B)
MNKMLIGISPDYLYLHNEPEKKICDLHKPYFLAFHSEEQVEKKRLNLINRWKENNSDSHALSKIVGIGEVEDYKSFWDFKKKWKVFKVYTEKSFLVPELSDYLFFNYNLYTAEHDIPYKQRVLTDFAAIDKYWLYDSRGAKKTLKCLVYDIETTQYLEGKENIPIDIIGYSDFDIVFESYKNLETEEFGFDIIDIPDSWDGITVRQLVSRNIDEEIDNLIKFCKIVNKYDFISGHNIIGFDNYQIYNRINWLLKNYKNEISEEKKDILNKFIMKKSRTDKSFYFGVHYEAVLFYPGCLDTYQGVRKFYSFLNDFSLKSVAPFLGIEVKDRIILTPSQIKIDERTLKYNRHDVQEQLGVTLNIVQQALPLSFTTCMPFDMLLSSGAVHMWDHMSMIRASLQKKIMPPICRVLSISQAILRYFRNSDSKYEIVKTAKKIREQLSKELIRVIKYGEEMPDWVLDPNIIYNKESKDSDDILSYHIPGGMTIKPDKDTFSHFIPWWYLIVADVGAMYPTILKAMNIGADTVRLAKKHEEVDDWIWLKKIPDNFLSKRNIKSRNITKDDSFADKGIMLGIKIDTKPGVVNCAMTGIMGMIAKIKKELKDSSTKRKESDVQRLKMMYQSIKGARNAGTHGVLSAPTVSGRQFNLWGASAITTKGQVILSDTLNHIENRKIRVVYGDTDGIYLACSRSIGNIPNFKKSLGVNVQEEEDKWITRPEIALNTIDECNRKWQKKLNYPDFELEPEFHDIMIFVKHKNYLIFDSKNGKIEMVTKGNNFKGSDKADIARKILKKIMIEVIKENMSWDSEEEARKNVKESIIIKTKEAISKLDLSKVELDDLTLIQSVQPAKRYKTNQDGSMSTFGKRSVALENLMKQQIKSRIKIKFVVTKKPLPGIINPSKSGVKPIDYMYPVDLLKNKSEIDLDWYKKMIENYIQGAFGLSERALSKQTGLDVWM